MSVTREDILVGWYATRDVPSYPLDYVVEAEGRTFTWRDGVVRMAAWPSAVVVGRAVDLDQATDLVLAYLASKRAGGKP